MEPHPFKIYPYRWVVLLVFMFVIAINQLLWITFAPITSAAVEYYGVSDLSIGLLSMSFMIVYIFVSIPASWVIDTYGIRIAVGTGAVLTGVFGLMRGLLATSYTFVLIAQIGIAIGQPFILNAITKVAARWFPREDRATAAGIGSLAMYLGIVGGLVITPFLILRTGIEYMLLVYGIVAVAGAILFFALAKERPPTPPGPLEQEERSLVFEGLKNILRQKDFLLLMLVFFIGLGMFNGVTTWIEDIVKPRGFSSTQSGVTGGLMVAGGVIGAVIIPLLSDHYRKRKPFLLLSVAGASVGLVGITFATNYGLLLASSFTVGFFLLSAGPIGFQYGAEITYPAPEGTSNGLLLLMGQISGIAFIIGMDSFKSPETGSMTPSLLVLIGLMILGLVATAFLKDSTVLGEGVSEAGEVQ